jgi:hypothetical protein
VIGLSRRMFLKRGSVAVAMAGVATSMPLLSEVASGPPASEAASTAASASAASADVPAGFQMTEELVAHVRDLGTGEINVFFGERQVVLKDPGLARALFQATR